MNSYLFRESWTKYFQERNIPVIFFSAISSEYTAFDLIKEISRVCAKSDIESIGFIGFPNVGKSSTINKILGKQKVATGAMPGKTKHTQVKYLVFTSRHFM